MKLFHRIRGLSACLLVCALGVGSAGAADETVTLNFVNADIDSVIKAVGMISGRNFVIDPRVKGTVNIVSAHPVARDMTYTILLSALRLQGFAAVEGNGVTKIVPEAEAKQNFSVTTGKDMKASGDRIVTQVYPLQHESATQLVPVLRPLITPNNSIAAYANTNTLVITDYADNVKRINKIIESIDQPNYGEITVIRLHYVSALDLAQMLNRLLADTPATTGAGGQAAAGESGQKFVVVPDVRSNSLLVRSDNSSRIARVRSLAAQLDVPGTEAGNIHVIYLRNAEAVKLAETLRAIVSGEARSATASTNSFAPTTSSSTSAGLTGSTGATSTAPSFASNTASNTSAAGSGSIIQADAQSNSLIITAPDNVYNSLRAVVDKLDARRAQVYVEALIVEVDANKAAEFGIQWQTPVGGSSDKSVVVAGTNFSSASKTAATGYSGNIVQLSTGTVLPSAGLNVGVLQKLTVAGKDYGALTTLARALESDSNTNILSTPNLLTLDNEEAKIMIGQNVPFITGSYAQSTGTTASGAAVNPFQTIERKDVGLTLKIKPQVSEGGSVKMQIYQEASTIDSTTNAAGIITNKRSIESTVLVDDGQIIVLGGLIQDTVVDGTDKVPLLGDIPVIGNLFQYGTRSHVKSNLMVFLQPKVLRDADSSASVSGDRYDYIRNEQVRYAPRSRPMLPDVPAPVLTPKTSSRDAAPANP